MKIFALIVALSSFAVSAQDAAPATPQRGNGQHLNQAVQIESQSHQERIGILNRADACIKAAKTPQAYKACETQEKQERQALRDKLKPQKEALRAEVQQQRQAHAAQRPNRQNGQTALPRP
jgi:hypothetical protein